MFILKYFYFYNFFYKKLHNTRYITCKGRDSQGYKWPESEKMSITGYKEVYFKCFPSVHSGF